MKTLKKFLSIMLAVAFVTVLASISVFAGTDSASDSFGNRSYYNLNLSCQNNVDVTASGTLTSPNTSDVLRVDITAGCIYAESGSQYTVRDDGRGWMGNPGFATAYMQISGKVSIAFSENHLYENGVYIETVGLSCTGT